MSISNPKVNITSEENIAKRVLTALFDTEEMGQDLKKTVNRIVGEYG
jgi:hypothetical protein